ncbi:MAG: glycine betaine/L-proline ABC transporter ATP-binding protein [Chloroflexi bacterium]|nr:glycine betaine/L-proline ABC transporter ATP-binding protein [Chloroflexota bacterium]MBI3930856.1 glycine betaine/L-proline ABC transporter ATP-binding protein [Chloroflexota bacterium]
MSRNDKVVISCQNVWKIFGDRPKVVWDLLKEGATRQEIIEQTGQVTAVKDVSFDVRENEIFVIMGLSGSGKSTLLRCINRLIEPDTGKIFIQGEDITRMNRAALRKLRRHQLSMVFQHFGLLPHRSVLDNVAFGLEIRGDSKKQRQAKSMEALELVGLHGWENSRLHELSGGMQQRVGLARALVVDSEILLMDEPFSALDPLIRRQLQDEFIKLRSAVKKTVVFVTHDLFEALKLGDRIAIMKDGEIIQLGSPQEIVSQPFDDYVSEFVRDVPKAKIFSAETIMEEPEVVIWGGFDSELAIKEMTAKKALVAFITDSRGELKGVVTIKQALEAVKRGPGKLEEIAQEEFPSTSPDSPLEDSLHFIAEGDIPVAVLDGRRHLLGVITRKALISAMKPEKPNSNVKVPPEDNASLIHNEKS